MNNDERFEELWADFKARVAEACGKPAFDSHRDNDSRGSAWMCLSRPMEHGGRLLVSGAGSASISMTLDRERTLALAADLVASVAIDDAASSSTKAA